MLREFFCSTPLRYGASKRAYLIKVRRIFEDYLKLLVAEGGV
jgi:hypothetical protein